MRVTKIYISILALMTTATVSAMTPVRNEGLYSKKLSLKRARDQSQSNFSFLSNQKFVWKDPTLNDILFDRQMVLTMKQDYEDQNRDYEMRERYKLVDRNKQSEHLRSMNRFSEEVINQIRDRQKEIHMNKLKDFAKKDPNIRMLKRPAAVLGVLYGLYKGEEFELPIASNEMRLRAYTKALERRGGFKLYNPIINTGFDMMAKAPQKRDAFEPVTENSDTMAGSERYRVHVWRSIPGLDVTSSLAYAFTTDTANATFSKPIVAHLTAQVDGSRVMRTNFKTATQNEGRVSLNYGVSF